MRIIKSGCRGGKTLSGQLGTPQIWRDEVLTDLLNTMLLLEAEAHFAEIEARKAELFPDGEPEVGWLGNDTHLKWSMLNHELAQPYRFARNWERVIDRWEAKHRGA